MGLIGNYGLEEGGACCVSCGVISSWKEVKYKLIIGNQHGIKFRFCERCWKRIVKQVILQSGNESVDNFK